MRGPRRSVRIIECSDNRSSDNRGFTVCNIGSCMLILVHVLRRDGAGSKWPSIHKV